MEPGNKLHFRTFPQWSVQVQENLWALSAWVSAWRTTARDKQFACPFKKKTNQENMYHSCKPLIIITFPYGRSCLANSISEKPWRSYQVVYLISIILYTLFTITIKRKGDGILWTILNIIFVFYIKKQESKVFLK